jgi:hypothetical protein
MGGRVVRVWERGERRVSILQNKGKDTIVQIEIKCKIRAIIIFM